MKNDMYRFEEGGKVCRILDPTPPGTDLIICGGKRAIAPRFLRWCTDAATT